MRQLISLLPGNNITDEDRTAIVAAAKKAWAEAKAEKAMPGSRYVPESAGIETSEMYPDEDATD